MNQTPRKTPTWRSDQPVLRPRAPRVGALYLQGWDPVRKEIPASVPENFCGIEVGIFRGRGHLAYPTTPARAGSCFFGILRRSEKRASGTSTDRWTMPGPCRLVGGGWGPESVERSRPTASRPVRVW